MIFAIFACWVSLVVGFCVVVVWCVLIAIRHVRSGDTRNSLLALAFAVALIATPFCAWKAFRAVAAANAKTQRVPNPLTVESTEYAVEQSSGFGMPGDNETGFVVYKLTPESVDWLGHASLPSALSIKLGDDWRSTPVDAARGKHPWHPYDGAGMGYDKPHKTGVAEYLDQWGYDALIDSGWLKRADRLINSPGSFYRYDRGGSVTLLDPQHGRVYFFYAG